VGKNIELDETERDLMHRALLSYNEHLRLLRRLPGENVGKGIDEIIDQVIQLGVKLS